MERLSRCNAACDSVLGTESSSRSREDSKPSNIFVLSTPCYYGFLFKGIVHQKTKFHTHLLLAAVSMLALVTLCNWSFVEGKNSTQCQKNGSLPLVILCNI